MAKIKSMNRTKPEPAGKPDKAQVKASTKQPTPKGKQPTDICPVPNLTRNEVALLLSAAKQGPYEQVSSIVDKLANALKA